MQRKAQSTILGIYNKILTTGDVSSILRDVIITVLHEGKGSKKDCNNYRGISLMAHRGKVLERMILDRLQRALKHVIPLNQFGFTTGVGTPDAILISGIGADKEQTGLVMRCYVDLTEAYDKFNRELLWNLLHLSYEIPEELIRIINFISFHQGAVAKLRFSGVISPEKIRLERGLKQGSVSSPILFNICMGGIISTFADQCIEKINAGR